MIDLDLLDQQLEHALTDELRTLRSVRTARPASPQQPPEPKQKLSTADWEWDDPQWGDSEWSDDSDWVPDAAAPAPTPAPAPPRPAPAPRRTAPTPQAAAPSSEPPRAAPAPSPEPGPAPEPEPAFRPRRETLRFASRAGRPEARRPFERLREAAAAMEAGSGAPRERSLATLGERIPELLAQGLLDEADAEIATHAAQVSRRGIGEDRLDASAWATMRALLDGRRDDAFGGLADVERLGRELKELDAAERFWTQRFWIALEWGDEAEQYEVLDHCRERAYRYGDAVWRAAMSVQHARMGRDDEAARELDAVAAVLEQLPADATRLDIATNLAETAFLLDDARSAAIVQKPLSKGSPSPLVVIGPGWVCKGSTDRFLAHLAAASGKWKEADKRFSAAVTTHRNLDAQPILARTLREWGSTLVGRDDNLAHRYLDESADLARRLQLTGLPAGRLALSR